VTTLQTKQGKEELNIYCEQQNSLNTTRKYGEIKRLSEGSYTEEGMENVRHRYKRSTYVRTETKWSFHKMSTLMETYMGDDNMNYDETAQKNLCKSI